MLGLVFFIFGASLGSFANVVIYRFPKGESVVSPRSRCPHCGKMIAWFDNIPVLSWLCLLGKCRGCRKTISWRYPLVEMIVGVLFVALFNYVGWNWNLAEYLVFSFMLVVASFIDFDHMILPDVITLPGILLGLLGAWLNPARDIEAALVGAFLGGGFLWLTAKTYEILRKQEGLGGGDIKLMAWVGAILGWKAIPFVILVGSLFGSTVGFVLAFQRKEGLKTAIPFGPYLAGATLAYIFGGDKIAEWYFRIFLP